MISYIFLIAHNILILFSYKYISLEFTLEIDKCNVDNIYIFIINPRIDNSTKLITV